MSEENKNINVEPGKTNEEPKGKKHLLPRWARISLKTIMWAVVAVLLIPVLLYIPPVQTLVKNVACNMVKKSTGMDIGIDSFRLKFPLDVSLKGVTVLEASGDTMVRAKEVIADLQLLPLLRLDAKVNRLELRDGYYRMVSPDSSMILKLNASLLKVDNQSSANIAESKILLHDALLKGADVQLYMDVWKKKPSPADSTSAPFFIQADRLKVEDITFAMSMLPTIDTLRFSTKSLTLAKGTIDLGANSVSVQSLAASRGAVTYLTPTPEYIKTHPAPVDTTSVAAPPMVIKGDSVSISSFAAIYAVKDAEPLPGFDPSYIHVDSVAVSLRNFYNAASTVRLPITKLEARERSGLHVTSGSGLIAVSEQGLSLDSLSVQTLYSNLQATAEVPFALMEMKPEAPVEVEAQGSLGWPDIEAFMPTLAEYTSKMPQRTPLDFNIGAHGTLGNVQIPTLNIGIDRVLSLSAKGFARNTLDIKKLTASLNFDGNVTNPAVLDNLLGETGVKLPTLKLKGHAAANGETYSTAFSLLTSSGDVAADGRVSMGPETYEADVQLKNVNVAHFVPEYGVGPVTARIQAQGISFDPTRKHAVTDVKLDVTSLVYQKETLRDITADVTLADGAFTLTALSENPNARFHLNGNGTIAPDLYTFDIAGEAKDINLQGLGLSPTANGGSADITLKGSASPEKWIYDADLSVANLQWTLDNQYFNFPAPVNVHFSSNVDRVQANVDAKLTSLKFVSPMGLKPLVDGFTMALDTAMRQVDRRDLNVEWLQSALPQFRLDLSVSGKGDVGRYLNTMGLSMDTVWASLGNDSLIRASATALRLGSSSMRADTLQFGLRQRGTLLDYALHMGIARNNPLAEFADVNVKGYMGQNRLLVSLQQKNQAHETGYRLGFTTAFADSVVTVHFTPLKATIAYLPWTFNEDNHVDYYFASKHVDANLIAASRESSIKLITQPGFEGNDELNVAISNLKIQDFLRMSVFAPPITATVNSDLKIGYTKDWLYGAGDVNITDFSYDKIRVGDFDFGLQAGLNNDGSAGARLGLKIDGAEAMAAHVRLVPDSVTKELNPEKVGLQLTRFPLYIANAFLGADVARLSGYLNGKMDLKGTFSDPLLYGAIECDSVGVYIPMAGSSLKFDNDSVTVDGNIVAFNEFDVWGANRNPLVLNGTVDARKFTNPIFDLDMNARNFQLIGNTKQARSDIYGKLFFDLMASAKGPMEHFNINANVKVLNTTDITYVVPSTTTQQLTMQDAGDIVKFVNFNDTTTSAPDSVAPASVAMRVVAQLEIEPGCEVQVEIPGSAATGSGKVQIGPNGTLSYFQNFMGDMRLNGQLFTGPGYVKYNLPVMGVDFNFNPDSYVLFNGDLMNPILNINATQTKKVNIVQNGNSQLVNFQIGLDVTNNLSAPKVLFNLSTDDDMAIQNDLLSMTPDQRNMTAINLLITGQYNVQGAKSASSDLLQGTMYGILTSQLNNWLGNHVKGVDLSFGVDQYNTKTDGQSGSATSYSYQVSKALFNNRFKISVGGNYTTDASADENFSENLISDISFEYMLRQTSNTTMYARLFRHTGYESILEGEITETGVGFVLKRRLSDLRQLFNIGNPFRRERKEKAPQPTDTVAAPLPKDSTINASSHE